MMKSGITGLRAKVTANTGMEMRLYKVHEARRSPSDVSGRRISTNLRFFHEKDLSLSNPQGKHIETYISKI